MATSARYHSHYDVIIVGGSFSGAACAKRLVDSGYSTLILEHKKLPRHKPCSGIVSPRGHRFLLENFGPVPDEAVHSPKTCRGVVFHYPSMLSMPMDFHYGPTLHLNRKYSDHWALLQSGADVHERTHLESVEDKGTSVEVIARTEGEHIRYRARYVMGADGPNSTVVRSVYPGYEKTIPWFKVKQYFHERIDCPLDDDYFHFWVHPDLGFYTWSHLRNEGQIVGVGYGAGDDLNKRHERVVSYLEEKHGVRLKPTEKREGSINNFGLSLINRYVFGKGNIIITGQAAGFLNIIAEGMSCALHSGAIAGEATVDALRYNNSIQDTYRKMISSEVKRCSDQWNPFKIIFGNPHEADFMAALKRHSRSDRRRIIRDIWSFLRPWGKYGWGRQIVTQAVFRRLIDAYAPSRWL
ncbi:MAG: NAD(P)/FAD-dependent oxidoreductase [Nitrospirota bacterium]|nr:MAG: NAD(P)/FAD-dependent oxidoreductase [Nitrospirota bacterium]